MVRVLVCYGWYQAQLLCRGADMLNGRRSLRMAHRSSTGLFVRRSAGREWGGFDGRRSWL